MTHAISWAAVSSKPQAERESLHDQHRLNHALAEALDWDVLADITVAGESRSYHRLSEATENVEAYGQLKEAAQTLNGGWLIIKDRSRLARTRRLNREVADFLQDHNVRVYSRAMPPASLEERTESEVWGEAVEGGLSEVEVMRLKQRREMGMQARIRRGRMPSTLPWGFVRVADGQGDIRAVFDDPRAEEAVRFAVTRYQAGISVMRILQQAGHLRTATGLPWERQTVRAIVMNPNYYGLVAYGKRRTWHQNGKRHTKRLPPTEWLIAEAQFDAPFTPADWRATMAEYERRRNEHPRRRGTSYPLSGIVWCEECEREMCGSGIKGVPYYRCSVAWDAGPGYSTRHYFRLAELHRQLAEYLLDFYRDPDWLSAIAETAPDNETGLAHKKDLLMEQADDLLRRRKRWMDAYEDGAIELGDFSQRIQGLDGQEADLSRRLTAVDAAMRDEQRQADFLAYARQEMVHLPERLACDLSPSESDQLRAVAFRLFKRIQVRDKQIRRVVWKQA